MTVETVSTPKILAEVTPTRSHLDYLSSFQERLIRDDLLFGPKTQFYIQVEKASTLKAVTFCDSFA